MATASRRDCGPQVHGHSSTRQSHNIHFAEAAIPILTCGSVRTSASVNVNLDRETPDQQQRLPTTLKLHVL